MHDLFCFSFFFFLFFSIPSPSVLYHPFLFHKHTYTSELAVRIRTLRRKPQWFYWTLMVKPVQEEIQWPPSAQMLHQLPNKPNNETGFLYSGPPLSTSAPTVHLGFLCLWMTWVSVWTVSVVGCTLLIELAPRESWSPRLSLLSSLAQIKGRTHSMASCLHSPHTRTKMPPSRHALTLTLSPPSPTTTNTCWMSLLTVVSHLTPPSVALIILFPTYTSTLFTPRATTSSISSSPSLDPLPRPACSALSWAAVPHIFTSPSPLAPCWEAARQGFPPRIYREMMMCLRRTCPVQLLGEQASWQTQKQAMCLCQVFF